METLILIGLMILGVGIRLLLKWSTAEKAKRVFHWRLPLITALLSIVTNIALILVRVDLEGILPFTYFTAVMYGYLGDSIFKNLIKTQKPEFK